ncbi:hypothetical protein CFIMG_006831RA [Ceratocystis fimbriata CBS 114723]|uniref:Calcium channel YVC1 n=1 Tax=Ceratocystis fimbriata CBS 114723 TaxID=1035309 RepID=A0A2C5WU01_9PEZI|nr:hypothetical protein CFIMG_006831RA [Ceratocystis fimbriata CBS 114723]
MFSAFISSSGFKSPPPASRSVPELSRYPATATANSASQLLPEPRHATADFTEADDDDDDDDESVTRNYINTAANASERFERYAQREPVEDGRRLPVLPLFSASHLDSLPVYSLTHAIRILVQTRTETTLTWEQLRSPQVSQFLIKPMQQAIRSQHFSRATLYALMANGLQFAKETELYPGNAGASKTRSKVCELLAIKLLKEYNTRELIDALSYDFHPLQGFTGFETATATATAAVTAMKKPDSRTSTLEVAIRASAKHFLSHPLVIQQLEAIWSGAISFYSAADSLHRVQPIPPLLSSTLSSGSARLPGVRTPLLGSSLRQHVHYQQMSQLQSGVGHTSSYSNDYFHNNPASYKPGRRTVSLYDPRHASLFKLSRLRVPRYRSFLSTLSLAVLIGLFLAVLVRRSIQITGLELIFWFWSAGFMLDELVGFNEQGFSLYMMSFWNIFDLGILCMLILYYCMRAYGVFLLDPHHWNDMAYDVLAANAILLLPRIFSVLDHYPYFSQLLIAFRLMAVDLAAVLFLVIIACSGFFVYFTFSKNHQDSAGFAYSMFQIVMGFTPAAWDVWDDCNFLGRSLLSLFLVICHFVVVTILITVLTNSFMAIASNATEEHQFLFAINTISMVKNDSLFSYIPPGNIFAWLLMPLRYLMPLRHFVWLNRLIIKVTHFPILWAIFVYERYFLAMSIYEPTDLVDHPGVSRGRTISIADPAGRIAAFSPNIRVREESVVGYQKDRALEEVFRRPPNYHTLRNQRRNERRRNQTEIRNWMDRNDATGPGTWQASAGASENNWMRRYSMTQSTLHRVSDVRSTASDPADRLSNSGFIRRHSGGGPSPLHKRHNQQDYKDHTDGGDGDDELITNDEDEDEDLVINTVKQSFHNNAQAESDYTTEEEDAYFPTPTAARSSAAWPSSPRSNQTRKGLHNRTLSTSTIMFNPNQYANDIMIQESKQKDGSAQQQAGGSGISINIPTTAKRSSDKTPRLSPPARPIAMCKSPGTAGPSRPIFTQDSESGGGRGRRLSSIDAAMSESQILPDDDDENDDIVDDDDIIGGLSSSFQTQMAMALKHGRRFDSMARQRDNSDRDRMSRLVLARMKTLEESFAQVMHEMRELKVLSTSSTNTAPPTRHNSVVNLVPLGKPGHNSKKHSEAKVRNKVRGRDQSGSLVAGSGQRRAAPVRRLVNGRSLGLKGVKANDYAAEERRAAEEKEDANMQGNRKGKTMVISSESDIAEAQEG